MSNENSSMSHQWELSDWAVECDIASKIKLNKAVEMFMMMRNLVPIHWNFIVNFFFYKCPKTQSISK